MYSLVRLQPCKKLLFIQISSLDLTLTWNPLNFTMTHWHNHEFSTHIWHLSWVPSCPMCLYECCYWYGLIHYYFFPMFYNLLLFIIILLLDFRFAQWESLQNSTDMLLTRWQHFRVYSPFLAWETSILLAWNQSQEPWVLVGEC